MKIILLLSLTSLIMGCVGKGPAYYMKPPEGAIENGSGPTPVRVSDYKANSESFPTYNSINEFMPPTPVKCTFAGCYDALNIKILPTDIWHVRHIFNDKYLINSYEYDQRYCIERNKSRSALDGGWNLFSSDCMARESFSIYITPNGEIDGGWEVFFMSEMYFSPTQAETNQWERGVVFKPNKTLNSDAQ